MVKVPQVATLAEVLPEMVPNRALATMAPLAGPPRYCPSREKPRLMKKLPIPVALRNWANITDFKERVYPSPDLVSALSTSTPVSENVYVDYELWGCPINNDALSETLVSLLIGKRPAIPIYSLCMDCKIKGVPCILVSQGEPCLGPITRTGCGVLCPSMNRPCYGCFGPREGANIDSLLSHFEEMGLSRKDTLLLLDKMNTYAYRKVSIEDTG